MSTAMPNMDFSGHHVGHRCAHPNLRTIASLEPVLRLKRRQSILETCPVALRVDRTRLPRWRHLAAHRRSLHVDAAMRGLTDRASQRDAVRLRDVGAAHREPVWIKPFGKLRGHAAAQRGFRLRPVKRHTKSSATCAATQTGMFHQTGQRAPAARNARISNIEDRSGLPMARRQTYCTDPCRR